MPPQQSMSPGATADTLPVPADSLPVPTDSAPAPATTDPDEPGAPLPATIAPTAAPLPPPDHGRHAYLVLAACSLAQAPIWGYSLGFGVFQQYYALHSLQHASPAAIASVGTTQTGVLYLAVPVVLAVLTRFPRYTRPWAGPLGIVLAVAGLAASSAAPRNVPALVSTQGALYALGCALLFGPASLGLDEWFVARKGFATGVMWAAKGSVGIGMPLLATALLQRFGLAATLQAWAVASLLMALPALVVLRKPRVEPAPAPAPEAVISAPASSSSTTPTTPVSSSSHAFLRRPLFWLLMLGNTMQSLGYQIPNNYIATYWTALFAGSGSGSGSGAQPLGPFTGAILLTLLYCGSVPGAVVFGLLSDRLPATTVVLISSTGSVASVFGLWYVVQATAAAATIATDGHPSSSSTTDPFALLVVFVLVYGFFAGGFSSTWPAVQHAMRRRDPATDTGLVFGLLMGSRGLGFLLSGPVSGSLLKGANVNSLTAAAAAAAAAATAATTASTTAASAWDVSSAVLSPAAAATTAAAAAAVVVAANAAPVNSFKPLIICTGTTATLGAAGALWSLGSPCRRLGRRTLTLGQKLIAKMRQQ